jgi:hypothetical protein
MNGNVATLEKDMPNVACISGIKAWARQSQGEPNFGNMPTTLGITYLFLIKKFMISNG